MTIEAFDEILKKQKKSRFNVKLLLINNYDLTSSIKQIFDKNNFRFKDLREFQNGNVDQWFGPSKLNRIIENITEPTVLFSVSEVVRFYNDEDFKSFFTHIFAIENKGYDVYIPIFGLESRFLSDFYNNFYRRDEFDFFYKIDSEYKKITLHVVNFDISYPNRLDTISDWLFFYNNPTNNLICSPRPLVERISNQSNDDLITINNILNEKDFLEKYLEKSFPIAYNKHDRELWQKLIEDLKNSSLKELVQKELNLNQLSPIEILTKVCSRANRYLKWLLKGYALEYLNDDSYFTTILKNANIDEPLIDKVWFQIFDNFNLNHIEERFEILYSFYQNSKPKPKIEEKLHNLLSKAQTPESFITGITTIEKEFIIKLFNENKLSIVQLEKFYPDLIDYLNDVQFENNINWVREYFKEYKISKLKHQPTKKMNELLRQHNGSKELFFKWYEDLNFKELYHFNDLSNYKKLWIDGLGIEWVGLIKSHIESNYDYRVECFLSKSKLPTKTECNRFKDITKIETLDEYIHKQTSYKHPLNLIQEIEIIKDIIHQNIDDDLLIVSDHGFSAFCSFKSKTNSFSNDDHEGRCAKIDTLIEDVNYFSHDFDCGRYLVALNHNSLNHKTRREAHGGATPEEVIVPIIKISKKTTNKMQQEVKQPIKETKGFVEEELF